MSQNIRTVIVDHSALIREGLVHILAETKYRVSRVCSNIEEISDEDLIGEETLVLFGLDIQTSDEVAKIRSFRDQHAGAKIIILSPASEARDLLEAVDAGADCFLSKQVSSDALLKALDLVLDGGTVLPRACLSLLTQRADDASLFSKSIRMADAGDRERGKIHIENPQRLSRKEQQILQCLTQGASNKLIARQLSMAEATVKVHIKGILRKIRVKNRTQAAVWALNAEEPDREH